MIDSPQVTRTEAQAAALIRITIPRAEIREVMGPARAELLAALRAQRIAHAGPIFSHHLRMDRDTFDFELGVAVASPVAPAGRVQPGEIPSEEVALTVYQGPYEGLGNAWGEFERWIAKSGYMPRRDLWEFYVAGPERSPDPAVWRTELIRPLSL
jgi:effector-binding domain-containing protein